jgi:hypothetical protein
VSLIAALVLLTLAVLPFRFGAGHQGAALWSHCYQIRQESHSIESKTVLESIPGTDQWQARLQDVPVGDRDIVLFMQAARWADDIRTADQQYHRRSGTTSTGPA